MTDLFTFEGDGQTPLDPDEQVGLKPAWVATRGDLNDAEAANIHTARTRWLARPPAPEDLLDDLVLRRLHQDMFGEVWEWAGQYRTTERNIGVDPHQIAQDVRNLCLDARYWVTPTCDPAAVSRLHHRLVAIHPFPNGNGRHGRFVCDLLAAGSGLPTPTWSAHLAPEVRRERYLSALRALDSDPDDLGWLTSFVWPAP